MDVDVESLRARLPRRPLTRFAPSPTGYLHLGHVVNAIYVWDIARALGGRVLLRIEDHDRLRSRPEYERALLEDLAWLGFEADLGPVRQSDDPQAYEDAASTLAAMHHVYACDCSRREIAAAAMANGSGAAAMANGSGTSPINDEVPYTGRCRQRGLVEGPGRGLRIELSPLPERFVDARMGAIEQRPALQCGDLLMRDRDGFWTYQFAVTVDDCRQGIDLVIRGEDLLSSTGRQIQLARMLGRTAPAVYLHHGLVHNTSGAKLSKAAGDSGVRDLRAAGLTAAEVIAQARQWMSRSR